MTETISLELNTSAPIMLRSFPNGGWTVVHIQPGSGYEPREVGAFGSPSQMLEALHRALVGEDERAEPAPQTDEHLVTNIVLDDWRKGRQTIIADANREAVPLYDPRKVKAERLTTSDFIRLADDIDQINNIDKNIRNIGGLMDRFVGEWGHKVRVIIGESYLRQFRNDHLGKVVASAIIQALIDERESIAAEVEGHAAVPPAPWPFTAEGEADA